MKRYINLPIEKLVSDVPVDPVHVRELADSIMVAGPISPVLVREETMALIDGFHRVAAMKELGFSEVESILTPCDDEAFWDLRIMSATLHKAVTFARAVDWIDEAFKTSQYSKAYKNAFSLFQNAQRNVAPEEAQEWVQSKVKKWGLPLGTLTHWLDSKERMTPDLLEEAKEGRRPSLRPEHYIEAAHGLPGRPELQRQVIAKAEQEDLGSTAVREIAKALRRAEDDEEIIQNILKQPVARTEGQMVRDAKVEKILGLPETPPTTIEITGDALICMMDYNKLITSLEHLGKHIDTIPPHAKSALHEKGLEIISKIQEFNLKLYPPAEVEYTVKEIEQ